MGDWAAPARVFGLCRQEHPFGEDFVRVQKEMYCLCKAPSDRLMQNMPAPSCDSKQREGKHSIFIFSAAALSWSFFFFLLVFVIWFFFFFLCLRQVFGFSVLPKLFPGLSPAIRQSDSSETLQVNKFKC